MKKKLLFMMFFLLSWFFVTENVNAVTNGITSKEVEVECIYGNGISVNLSYDEENDKYNATLKEYPVSPTVTIDGDKLPSSFLFTGDGAYPNENIDLLKELTCPNEINVWKVLIGSRDDGNSDWVRNYYGVYSFKYYYGDNESQTITSYYGGTGGTSNASGWWIFSEAATGIKKVITLTSTSPLLPRNDNSPEVRVPLVGERLYVRRAVPEDAYLHAFKSSSQEAIGNSSYVQILANRESDTYKYFAQKGNTLTYIGSGSTTGDLITGDYLCLKESYMEQDASRADFGYKFNQIRHKVAAATESDGNYTCPSGYVLYEQTDATCAISPGTQTQSFCEAYGNTAVVLIQIINIMQIVVPALVLVLTGIDITRIVIAGNVEEELPKKKKTIIVRLIIMLTFFFLPLITRLVVNLINDKEIYDVSCLFNNGVSTASNTSHCIDPSAVSGSTDTEDAAE